MSRARLSIFIYSIYLASGGLAMAIIPNVILSLVGHPTTSEPWVRLFGALAFVLGAKGFNYSRLEIESMFQFDVYTRSFFASFLLVLVLIGYARPILLVWTVIDYGASLWTALAIRADRRNPVRTAAA
jgi:hypothetical protein